MVKLVDQISTWLRRKRGEKKVVSVGLDWAADFSSRFPLSQLHIFQYRPNQTLILKAKLEILRSSTTLVTTAHAKTKRFRSYKGRKVDISDVHLRWYWNFEN
jgi:hypothetical protein